MEDVEREAGPRSREVTASRRLEVTWLESEAEVFLGGDGPCFSYHFRCNHSSSDLIDPSTPSGTEN